MGFVAFIILGLIAGTIARLIIGKGARGGWIATLLLGVVGAVVGGWIADSLFGVSFGDFWDIRSWLIAVGGALVVLFVWGLVSRIGSRAKK